MPENTFRPLALIIAPLALAAVALTGCTASGPAESSTVSSDTVGGGSGSGEDIDVLLDIERAGVSILADQWVNNDCSVELALSPDDLICAGLINGADLAETYEDVTGGLADLSGDPAAVQAVRTAFDESRDAAEAWNGAGCEEDFDDACADEAEELIASLLALDTAFDEWAA